MTPEELKDINIGKLKNARHRVVIFNDAKKPNLKLDEAKWDVKFHEAIERILETKSKNPTLNEFLRVAVKEEWVIVAIQTIVNDMIQEESVKFLQKCERWAELLKIDGGNTKHQVLVDIEKLIGYSNIIEEKEKGEKK